MLELNMIHQGDCMQLLKSLPDCSIDLVVTSPPYNLKGLKVSNGKKSKSDDEYGWVDVIEYDGYDDDMNEEQYQQWQIELLDEIFRVLTPSGSLFYNHKDRACKGTVINPLMWIQHSKLNLKQIIVWDRKTSLNSNANFYLPSTEYIYWLTKSKKNVRFNRQLYLMKDGDQKGEYVNLASVWTVSPGQKFKYKGETHPAPYPIELVDRIIPSVLSGGEGNIVVLDPFMGSGTTAISAIKNGVNWLGFEQSEKYIEMANERIEKFKETRK